MKIKIAHIITKLELGGAQKNALSILEGLSNEKYEKFLLTSRGLLEQKAGGIPLLKLIFIRGLVRSVSPLKDIIALLNIYLFLKKEKIDLAHTHSSKAGIIGRLAAKLAGTKTIIHTVHGWSFNNFQNFFVKNFYILLERITAKFAAKIIVVSKYDMEQGLRLNIARLDKFELLPYGIKIETRPTLNLKNELNIPNKSIIVGVIACFKPQKAHRDFVEIAKIVLDNNPNVHFLLAGDGLLRRQIQRSAERSISAGNFHFLGFRNDITNVYNAIDMLMLCSLWEGLPLVFLEAMSFGRPIIATEICANNELIKDNVNGFLIPPKKYGAFAHKILQLSSDSELRQRMGAKGRELFPPSFLEHNMLSNIEKLYHSLL